MMNRLEVGQLVWYIKEGGDYLPLHYRHKEKRVVKCKVISGMRKKGTSIFLMAMHLSAHNSEKMMFKPVEELIFTAKTLKQQIKKFESEGFTIEY